MESKLSNPAPLGLLGFGMTTILLNIHNAGFFPLNVAIFAMGIFYGGIAQVIAGILEYRKGNTFGTTAFISYGMFWLTLVFILIAPQMGLPEAWAAPPAFLGWYLCLWGLFTLFMVFPTLKKNGATAFVFISLTVLFFLLAIGHWIPGDAGKIFIRIGGWEGIVCGLSAVYLAAAEVLNESCGKSVLPVFAFETGDLKMKLQGKA
ncbi:MULTISPECIES: acetate uptake transporter [Dehalococcoides]|uniref:acetate uptake transporter n=1 Tax=Dehalococcoides TaxID=61434 RepID=UPI0005B566F0|nr:MULTISPECIES: GPR1/FUN34/YaaH family transporter [Dehalococcoides]QYY58735.1 acetate uptake transporter [Dehalococcoides mccartyi]BAQ35363.1 hypothetical protein UCH007_14050 [Dehalococcoides sp. UCH007]